MSKLTTLVVFGAGYVLGARAGRGRYEQIRAGAQRVAEDPRVQSAAGTTREKVGEVASTVAETAKEKVGEVASTVAETAKDRVGRHTSDDTTDAPPPGPSTVGPSVL